MPELVVHVINAGIGESIVLQLPTGGWGVVDCYASSLDDPASNPALCFLNENNVKELEFLCLTHPHEDHYRGMSQILERFKVRYFWQFGAFTVQYLRNVLLRYFVLVAQRDKDRVHTENAIELTRVLEAVQQKVKKGDIEKVMLLNDYKPLYPLPVRLDREFDISSIAPSSDMCREYESNLGKCFGPDGKIVGSLRPRGHNMVSAALLIRYGATRVILCGDVEAKGWGHTLQQVSHELLSAHGVKVAHHGSTTGYTKDLWGLFSIDQKPHAVVTPFRRFRLPKKEALDHIKLHTSVLLTTCRSATPPEVFDDFDLWQTYPITVEKVLRSAFRSFRADRPSSEVGRCALVFDRKGGCSYTCSGGAGVIAAAA